MHTWEPYGWADEATEATIAVVADGAGPAEALLSRLGAVQSRGDLRFEAALELQGTFYDDDTLDRRSVFQAALMTGRRGDWWVTVEPNGVRARSGTTLRALAAEKQAASFFWDVNAVMSVTKVDRGRLVAEFDPLLDVDRAPADARDLPFGEHPGAAAMALLERWSGVAITQRWFLGPKPTFIVRSVP